MTQPQTLERSAVRMPLTAAQSPTGAQKQMMARILGGPATVKPVSVSAFQSSI
jgi:hypothetical protein